MLTQVVWITFPRARSKKPETMLEPKEQLRRLFVTIFPELRVCYWHVTADPPSGESCAYRPKEFNSFKLAILSPRVRLQLLIVVRQWSDRRQRDLQRMILVRKCEGTWSENPPPVSSHVPVSLFLTLFLIGNLLTLLLWRFLLQNGTKVTTPFKEWTVGIHKSRFNLLSPQ
jgi:hypothetical protein